MSRKLLVTGGAGFIGCNFVHYWMRQHPDDEVVVLDALTYAGNRANLAPVEALPNFEFIHGDIRDTALVEQLLRDRRIDTLVHFAAESHVDRSIAGPDAFIETNVNGTHSLLKAARAVWLAGDGIEHRFHHVSTDEVYGSLGEKDPPFTEEHPYQPNSPYSASKAASDHLVRAYHHTYGLRVTTSNCSNNYGPYHHPEKLIPLAITNMLHGVPIPLYGDGGNVRDWLHVEDHSRGIEAVLKQGKIGEVYNIGGGNEWNNRELLALLCQTVDRAFAEEPDWVSRYPDAPPSGGMQCSSLVTPVEDRPGHDRRYAISADKLRTATDWHVERDFAKALRETATWYMQNPQWWASHG